jgi:hypothetical protein
VTLLDLLKEHPKACERLGIATTSGNYVSWQVAHEFRIGINGPGLDRHVAGAALLWLAERRAWVETDGNRWDVVALRNPAGCVTYVRDTPLEAMLVAIENFVEGDG